jgi:hypothetical protein
MPSDGVYSGVRRVIRAAVSVVVLLLSAGCGRTVDLATALQVEGVATGWSDAGEVDGKTKLVPTVRFRLKNASDQNLRTLQVNALFRRVTDANEWGSGFVTAAGSDGLPPGAATDPLSIASQLGYTGTEESGLMLTNSRFVDAKVDLFAKYGSAQWVRVGEFAIARQLIPR